MALNQKPTDVITALLTESIMETIKKEKLHLVYSIDDLLFSVLALTPMMAAKYLTNGLEENDILDWNHLANKLIMLDQVNEETSEE
jgi:hypothetical protein